MKKIFSLVVIASFIFIYPAFSSELKQGMKATNWMFKDVDKKEFSMDSWKGKVMMINYVDPDESDLNEHFTDAVKKATDSKVIDDQYFKGIGIADCAATWKPNFAIRAIAGRKAKKYDTTILFDYDAMLRDAWGLKKDTSNIIIVDKNRVCRAIIRGRVPDDQVDKLIKLIIQIHKQ